MINTEKARMICSSLWTLFIQFYKRNKKTTDDWEVYMAGCNEVVNQYEYGSPEHRLAQDMALAFMKYSERKEK